MGYTNKNYYNIWPDPVFLRHNSFGHSAVSTDLCLFCRKASRFTSASGLHRIGKWFSGFENHCLKVDTVSSTCKKLYIGILDSTHAAWYIDSFETHEQPFFISKTPGNLLQSQHFLSFFTTRVHSEIWRLLWAFFVLLHKFCLSFSVSNIILRS